MLRPLEWIVRLVLIGAMFVYFGVGSLVLSYALLPLARRGVTDERERVRRAQSLISRGFKQFHALMHHLRLMRYDPREVSLSLPEGPCVVVANHPTLVDVTALGAALGGACTVVRSDLFENPFVGRILRACWHIDAGEGAAMSGAAVIQGAIERIEAGFRVLIFPEGTRSPPGGVRRFRRGAFEVACRAGVPVALVLVTCTPPTLMKGVPWYALPKRLVRLAVEPIATLRPEDFDGDARRLAKAAQEMYRARLDAWRAAHPEDVPAAPSDAPKEGVEA
ncbi:MAG: lysophospholipid acyltransferase family protein [Polyangiales bacterium]